MKLSAVTVFFSKPKCPYCDKLEALLQEYELPYVKLSLGGDRNYDFTREQFDAFFPHGTTFPQAFIGGDHIGGFTEFAKLIDEAQAQGLLPSKRRAIT